MKKKEMERRLKTLEDKVETLQWERRPTVKCPKCNSKANLRVVTKSHGYINKIRCEACELCAKRSVSESWVSGTWQPSDWTWYEEYKKPKPKLGLDKAKGE